MNELFDILCELGKFTCHVASRDSVIKMVYQ